MDFSPPHSVSIRKICETSLNQVREFAEDKRLHLYTMIDGRVRSLLIQESRLEALMSALLLNAILATPNGGSVGLEVAGDPVHETVHFTVWDSSPGMDAGRAYNLFLQKDPADHRRKALSQLPELVAMHEGVMSVDTSTGSGMRVTISLPWHKDGLPPPVELCEEGRILLVDDDDLILYIVSSYLTSCGYDVVTATNGMDALARMEEFHPDLILMDIHMPIMGGLEAIRSIRQSDRPEIARIPIVALTVLSMLSDQHDCLEAGADDYISKPVSLRWLNRKIKTHLLTEN